MNDRHEPPKPSLGDAAHAIARAGLSTVPAIGGPAVELFNTLVTPSLERRRIRWMEDVASALRQLEDARKLSLEDLAANETFVDTVLKASSSAIRNSQEEKRAALKNAVLNSALAPDLDATLQEMFLSWIDDLTVWHLRIVRLFLDPAAWGRERGIQYPGTTTRSLAQILETALPELRGRRELYDQIWSDLFQRGLVSTERLQGMMTADGALARRTTDLGERFVRFISEP